MFGGIICSRKLSELLKNSKEVKARSGRVAYIKDKEYVAVECISCKEVKRVEDFSGNIRGFAGRQTRCKKCVSNKYKEDKGDHQKYYEENKEEIRIKNSEYYLKNKKYFRSYYLRNGSEIKRKAKERRRLEGKSYDVEYARNYYEKNKNKIRIRERKYKEINEEYYKKYMRGYREKNRELFKTYELKRRAKINALPRTITEEEYKGIVEYFNGRCSLSGVEGDLHSDHVIPLSIGHGGSVKENLIPLSWELNTSKGGKHIFEWFEANGSRFNLKEEDFVQLIQYLSKVNGMTVMEYRKYVDWCFDNPRTINNTTGKLVFK